MGPASLPLKYHTFVLHHTNKRLYKLIYGYSLITSYNNSYGKLQSQYIDMYALCTSMGSGVQMSGMYSASYPQVINRLSTCTRMYALCQLFTYIYKPSWRDYVYIVNI